MGACIAGSAGRNSKHVVQAVQVGLTVHAHGFCIAIFTDSVMNSWWHLLADCTVSTMAYSSPLHNAPLQGDSLYGAPLQAAPFHCAPMYVQSAIARRAITRHTIAQPIVARRTIARRTIVRRKAQWCRTHVVKYCIVYDI